jgi:hypothetical protein
MLALCASALFFAYRRYQHWCHDDYDSVASALYAAAPNAAISIGSEDEDGLGHYDVRDARIDLDGSGTRIIELAGPQGLDLRAGTHLFLTRVGPYYFTVMTPDQYQHCYIDIGSNGAVASLLPIQFNNINDLVARYDQLLAAIRRLPPTSKFTDRDGKTWQVLVRYIP